MGHWMSEARNLISRHHDDLAMLPVWLFSSGPIGADDPKPQGDPQDLADLALAVKAEGHKVFAGKLDKKALGFGERLVTNLVRSPEGDFRDWEAIKVWAREIAGKVARLRTAHV
jgi:menaquinone-dependent protoporphyrinogen oxidase